MTKMLAARHSVLAGLAIVGASAISASQAAPGHASGERVASASSATVSAKQVPARLAAARSAVLLAGRQVQGGRPYDVEDERAQGRLVWEVKVAVGSQRPYRYLVSANGKQIVRRGRMPRFDDDAARALRAQVPLARALTTAGGRAGGRFSEAEIDDRNDAIVWKAKFDLPANAETEVVVDARTGTVRSVTTRAD